MGSSMGLPNQRWQHESPVCGEWVEGACDGVGDSRLLMHYNYHDKQEAPAQMAKLVNAAVLEAVS